MSDQDMIQAQKAIIAEQNREIEELRDALADIYMSADVDIEMGTPGVFTAQARAVLEDRARAAGELPY